MKIINKIFDIFKNQNKEIYLVGGAVRDLLCARDDDELYFCNQKSRPGSTKPRFALSEEYFWDNIESGKIDLDFATSALPEEIMTILKNNNLKVILIGVDFGTIGTIINNSKIEITTFRCDESYKKGSRKPFVKFGKTIEEDLKRRDFSCNACAIDTNWNIIDPFEGRDALTQGLLLTPQENSEISFLDDPLRMLRAYRFEARGYGQLGWHEGKAVEKLKKEINMVSAERIFDEMSKILMTNNPSKALDHMACSGLLGEIFPELQKVIDFKQNQGKWHSKLVWPHTLQVVQQSAPILEVRWAALFHDVAKPQTYTETESGVHFYQHDWKGALVWDQVAARLRVGNEFRDHVHVLIYEHLQPGLLSVDGPNNVTDKALRRLMVRLGDKLENLFHLSVADISSHKPIIVEEKKANCLALLERCKKLNEECNVTKLKLPSGLGIILMKELSLEPGKKLGNIMKQLTQKLVDGEITLSDDFVKIAKELKEQ